AAQAIPGGLVLESAAGPPAASIPEIYVAEASGLPESPALQPNGKSGESATYRINARFVDVSLVALDKKGRPLTNLNPDDLEVYDNGSKVDLRSFAQAGGTPSTQSVSAVHPTAPEAPVGISNRIPSSAKLAPGDLQNTIVLLLDDTLSFDDLQNAREQMGRFIKGLRENERAS